MKRTHIEARRYTLMILKLIEPQVGAVTKEELHTAIQMAEKDIAANWTCFSKVPSAYQSIAILGQCIQAYRRCVEHEAWYKANSSTVCNYQQS
jgi:hypothetical protein